jgi:hypothetical protein
LLRRLIVETAPAGSSCEKSGQRSKEHTMRFMILVPSASSAMAAFREELARAGVLLDAIGSKTLIEVRSREEALEWARRCPDRDGIEVRPLLETEDFR